MTTATPRPWEYDGGRDITGPWDGKTIPIVVGLETTNRGYESFETLILNSADAEHIVRCVNLHEELVHVLKRLEWSAWRQSAPECPGCGMNKSGGHTADCELGAVLAKARP